MTETGIASGLCWRGADWPPAPLAVSDFLLKTKTAPYRFPQAWTPAHRPMAANLLPTQRQPVVVVSNTEPAAYHSKRFKMRMTPSFSRFSASNSTARLLRKCAPASQR